MNSVTFVLLVAAGSLGILLSFVQARSRAVLAEDGFAEPSRRAVAMGLLGAVLLLTVAIPFAGGMIGAQPETRELSLVSVFAVHAVLLFFLACYYALSDRRSLREFLALSSERPARDLSVGVLIGIARLGADDPGGEPASRPVGDPVPRLGRRGRDSDRVAHDRLARLAAPVAQDPRSSSRP